jgi:hypothetical protein
VPDRFGVVGQVESNARNVVERPKPRVLRHEGPAARH